jgi:hypothetical protein
LLWGGGQIFNGYFKVNDLSHKVLEFYETINGSTNFNNNIFADVDFSFNRYINNNDFEMVVNSMNYYSNPSFPNYNPTYAYFKFYKDSDFSLNIIFNENKEAVVQYDVLFTIQSISDPTCFNEGTKILCLNKNFEEEYILIENLRKGDLVKSYKHGYRKIDLIGKNIMINNPEKFNECMYKMEKTEENGLIEDLIVTGGHSILVDDLGNFKEENDKIFGRSIMIDDKYLLLSAVSNDFKKLENTDLYTYYHFILENNGNNDERFGVCANGILTETSSKKQFTNHKYTLL